MSAAGAPRVPAPRRLVATLAAMAAEGRTLSNIDRELGDRLCEYGYVVRRLIERASQDGVIRLLHEGRAIAAIEAGDGTWRVPVVKAATATPERRCLRCRLAFRPEHRGRFLCAPCNLYAQANG